VRLLLTLVQKMETWRVPALKYHQHCELKLPPDSAFGSGTKVKKAT